MPTPEFRDGRYWDERDVSTFEPGPLTTADRRVVLDGDTVDGYMNGGCAALALALNAATGHPVVGVRCYGSHDTDFFVVDHMAVRLPDGLFLDARGLADDLWLIDGMIGGSFAIVEMTREEAVAARRSCRCPFVARKVAADAGRLLAALADLPRPKAPVLNGTAAPEPAAGPRP